MKNFRVSMVFRTVTLAAATMMVGLLAVGGAEAANNEGAQLASVDPSAVNEAVPLGSEPLCCEWGEVTCPSTGTMWEYFPPSNPSCGYTRLQALSYCDAACPVACTDTGWINQC